MITSLALALGTLATASFAQTSLIRDGSSLQIQLLDDGPLGFWGPQSRTADHAVVAMNTEKDILVAYHTDRNDLHSTLRPKQVEAALFDYSVVGGIDTWTYVTTFLLGAVHHDPLGILPTPPPDPIVKCERPDVVAVGDQFFVVWTRIYQHDFLPPPYNQDRAVLECAWVDPDAPLPVYDYFGASLTGSGRGFILDLNFDVLDCAGVPDAVVLDDGTGAGLPEVAVVFPAQTGFTSGTSTDRAFDLRIATCTLDVAHPTTPLSSVAAATLLTPIAFNGTDSMSAGMILPDLARGVDKDQFILAYEEQFLSGGLPGNEYGLIRMHRIVRSGGAWTSVQSHTLGNSQTLLARRRPNLSSHPLSGATINNVTIAFNTLDPNNPNADADVVFSEWIFDPDLGVYKVQWTSLPGQPAPGWPNDPGAPLILAYDFRPIPLHGRNGNFRKCYAETFTAPAPPAGNCNLVEYDLATNLIGAPLASAPLGRPAVGYLYDAANLEPDYVALTWEQRIQTGPEKWRIYLLVR